MATHQDIERLKAGVRKAKEQGKLGIARELGRKLREVASQQSGGGLPLTPEQRQAVAEQRTSGDSGGMLNFLSGDDRKVPDIPELNPDEVFGMPWGDHPGENLRTSAGTLMTFDDDGQKNLWSEQLKASGIEHRWERDPYGNDVLVYTNPEGEEKMGYVNAPGVSGRDLAALGAQGGAFALGGGLLRAVPKIGQMVSGAGRGARSAIAAGGAASQSYGLDSAANTLGADIDEAEKVRNAAFAGAAGAAMQPLGEAAASGLARGAKAASEAGKDLFRRATGTGDDAIRATREMVMESAGDMTPALENASPEFWRRAHASAKQANTPEEAVQAAIAEAYREEIPGFTPLRPYVTGQPADFAELDRVSRGGYGGAPQNELRVTQRQNQAALEERARTIREQVTGSASDGVGDTGETIRQNLRDASEESRRAVSEAYDLASRREGAFLAEGVAELPDRMEGVLAANSHKLPNRPMMAENYPATSEMVNAIREFSEQGDLPVQDFEQVRRYLQNQWRGARGSDRAASASLMREFDAWGDDMLDRALYAGDDQAIESLKAARAAKRRHQERFGQNNRFKDGRNITDRAGKVINDIINDDLSPVHVVNYMAGSNKMGKTKDALAVLSRLEKAVGRESPAWSALQEAGLLRMFYDDAGRFRNPSQAVKRWEQMSKGDARLWAGRLYGGTGLAEIEKFMSLLKRTVRDSRDYVPSGPAVDKLTDSIQGMAMRMGLASKFPIVGQIAGDVVDGLRRTGAERRAAREGAEAIRQPQLRYIPSADLSITVGEATAGGGAAATRARPTRRTAGQPLQ